MEDHEKNDYHQPLNQGPNQNHNQDADQPAIPEQNQINQNDDGPANQEHNRRNELEEILRGLDTFLGCLPSSVLCVVAMALLFGVHQFIEYSTSVEKSRIQNELYRSALPVCLAAVSLLCLSFNLREPGVRVFLSVDQQPGRLFPFLDDYKKQISVYKNLLYLVRLLFSLKFAWEVTRVLYWGQESWLSTTMILLLLLPWNYVTLRSLSASILFLLVCNFQVIHFSGYRELVDREFDVPVLMDKHARLREKLSTISHVFEIYFLLELMGVMASQYFTLLQITKSSETITLVWVGDFALSTVVQVVAIAVCLHAATKVSCSAQGIVSLACKRHASVTANTNDLPQSSYDKGQAFVSYLQANPVGISFFGWTIDRDLLITIFFIEFTLITFVLGNIPCVA